MERALATEAIESLAGQIEQILSNLPNEGDKNLVLNYIGRMLQITQDLAVPKFSCVGVFDVDKGGHLRYNMDLPCPPFSDFMFSIGGCVPPNKFKPVFQNDTFVINMGKIRTDKEEKELIRLGWKKVPNGK